MPATRGELFAGVTVAIVTPFKDGAVDWDELGKLVDWHCEQGTDALAPCGTTGESPTVTLAEAVELNQSAVSQHLALMRREGLLKTRREGQTIYYQLADRNVTRFFGLLEDMFCKRR